AMTSAGGNYVEMLATSMSVMDGADTVRGLFINITNVAHTGNDNDLHAIAVDAITGDADAYETGIHLGSGVDTHITFTPAGDLPPGADDYPDTGDIGLFVDDNDDYSGGGGNDCALVLIDSTGA
ncbi:unnamed protein product, partial [marine sediment metagenome]